MATRRPASRSPATMASASRPSCSSRSTGRSPVACSCSTSTRANGTLGKSEVIGLFGDPWQAFGPSLARRGFVVLAPDSLCFEDRRTRLQGTQAGEGESDWLEHYNAMAHRLVRGDTLMRRVLTDALTAVSLLTEMPELAGRPVGTIGHSYGGNTVLAPRRRRRTSPFRVRERSCLQLPPQARLRDRHRDGPDHPRLRCALGHRGPHSRDRATSSSARLRHAGPVFR